MKSKLCCVFNVPSLYREIIYTRIDEAYDCDWYFEDIEVNLVGFDTSKFQNVTFQKVKKIGPFYWVKGLLSLMRHKEYNHFLMMGHSRNLSTLVFLLLKKIFYPNKKAYLWTHGFYGKESGIEKPIKKLLLKSADGLFLYGNYARDLMLKMGFAPDKMHVIHNSLNYDAQLKLRQEIIPSTLYQDYFGNSNPVIIFIGRLNPIKKLDMIIESLHQLNLKGEKYNLVFVGDGPVKEDLLLLVSNYNLRDQVWFYGACYDEKVNAELVTNADLCIAPGNVGLTAMHSLMFGCPVITHDNFSLQMPEFESIYEGETGSFYKYGSQKSLTECISQWFKEKQSLRSTVRKNCYREIDTQWNPSYQMQVLSSVLNNN